MMIAVLCDLLMMGGAQDAQQEVVAKDLLEKKKNPLRVNRKWTPDFIFAVEFQYMVSIIKLPMAINFLSLEYWICTPKDPGGQKD